VVDAQYFSSQQVTGRAIPLSVLAVVKVAEYHLQAEITFVVLKSHSAKAGPRWIWVNRAGDSSPLFLISLNFLCVISMKY
jgi:hypothetical protein